MQEHPRHLKNRCLLNNREHNGLRFFQNSRRQGSAQGRGSQSFQRGNGNQKNQQQHKKLHSEISKRIQKSCQLWILPSCGKTQHFFAKVHVKKLLQIGIKHFFIFQGGVKMTVAVAQEIKEVVKDVTKFSTMVSTVQLHMAACLPANALKSFMNESLKVVKNVATCAIERVHAYSQRLLPRPGEETEHFLRFIGKVRNDVDYKLR